MKRFNNNGFTLAELLIVVAIIAVLVGISIPIFMGQLEKSREATDLANVRSAYAQVRAAALAENKDKVNYSDEEGYYLIVELCQKQEKWQSDPDENILQVGEISIKDKDHWLNDPDGSCKISVYNGETFIDWGGTGRELVVNWAGLSTLGIKARGLLPGGVDWGVIYGTEKDSLSAEELALFEEIKEKCGFDDNITIHYGWNPYPKIKISVVNMALERDDYSSTGAYSNPDYATRITYNPSTKEIEKVEKEYGRWGNHDNGKIGFWANSQNGKYPTETLYEK